jgi:HSP20 family protein
MSRRNPLEEIEDVFERMNRELETLGSQIESGLGGGPPVDLVEYDDSFEVVADLPGFTTDDVDVSLADRELTITAESETETEAEREEAGRYRRRERRHRSVRRRIPLPDEVVDEETSAHYEHGVLTVTLPKAETTDSAGTPIEVE